MIRTEVLGDALFTFGRASIPSSSGMRTSMITRSGELSPTCATTSVPVAASVIEYPSSVSNCLKSERIEASSSATKMDFWAISVRFLLSGSQITPLGPRSPVSIDSLCPAKRTCQIGARLGGRPGIARSGRVSDDGHEPGDGGGQDGGQPGKRYEDVDADRVAEDAAHEDQRQPTEVRESDPSAEDASAHARRRRLLHDR